MTRIVIGIGNRDRGDDGAGIAVAEGVTGVRSHVVSSGSLDLFDLWAENDSVVIVDAMRSGADTGTVQTFHVGKAALPSETFASTHAFGPAAAIEMARALGRMPLSLEVIGIEAGDFTAGATMSPAVARAVADLTKELSNA